MTLKAIVYKTPSCGSFVVVEDGKNSFASTIATFTGTHADILADRFADLINNAPPKKSFLQRLGLQ